MEGKGLIGIPHTGQFPAAFVEHFFQLRGLGQLAQYALMGQAQIFSAREVFANKVVKEGYDWLLFVDSDMIVPHDLLEKWTPKIQARGIIAAPCFKRFPPHDPCFYETAKMEPNGMHSTVFKAWPKEKLFEAGAVGAACMMISRETLQKITVPRFYPWPTAGEDITFCVKAREAGCKIWIDPTVRVGHIAANPIYEEDYLRCQP